MKRYFLGFCIVVCQIVTAQNKCGTGWLKADYTTIANAKLAQDKADTALKNTPNDTVEAKAYTQKGIYADFAGNRQAALNYYDKALVLLGGGYPQLRIYIAINRCAAYEALTDYGKMLEVANAAFKVNKGGSVVSRALLLQAIAVSYFRAHKIEESTKYILQGIQLLEKQKNSCYLPSLKLTLANNYILTNNYTFAIDLYTQYLNTQPAGTKEYTIAVVNYAECLIALKDFAKAGKVLTDALPDAERSGDAELEAVLLYRIANLEHSLNHTAKSLAYYKKAFGLLKTESSRYTTYIFSGYLDVLNTAGNYKEALALARSYEHAPAYKKSVGIDRMEFQQSLAESYKKQGDRAGEAKALAEALRLCDSLRLTGNGYNEQKLQAEFQTGFQGEKNALLARHNTALLKKVALEERLLYMYILASIAAIGIISMYLRGFWLKTRLQREKLKATEADHHFALQKQRHEAEISREQKRLIEEKQREVTSMALQLANYYDSINALTEKFDTKGYSTLNDIKRELLVIGRQKDYWKQFETKFNNLNPDFSVVLSKQFPQLTKNDLEFCGLLKLKLNNKELASLLQISHESVISKRYRIRKKMGLDEEALESLLSSL